MRSPSLRSVRATVDRHTAALGGVIESSKSLAAQLRRTSRAFSGLCRALSAAGASCGAQVPQSSRRSDRRDRR